MTQVNDSRDIELQVSDKPQHRTKLREIVKNPLASFFPRKRSFVPDQKDAQSAETKRPGAVRRITRQISDSSRFVNSLESSFGRLVWRHRKWYKQFGSDTSSRSRQSRGSIPSMAPDDKNTRRTTEAIRARMSLQSILQASYTLPPLDALRCAASNPADYLQEGPKITTAKGSANTETVTQTGRSGDVQASTPATMTVTQDNDNNNIAGDRGGGGDQSDDDSAMKRPQISHSTGDHLARSAEPHYATALEDAGSEDVYVPPRELPDNMSLGMAVPVLWSNSRWVKQNEDDLKRVFQKVNHLTKDDVDVAETVFNLCHVARALARKITVCEGAEKPYRFRHGRLLVRYIVNRFEYILGDFRLHYYKITSAMTSPDGNVDDVTADFATWAEEWHKQACELLPQLRKAGLQIRSPRK